MAPKATSTFGKTKGKGKAAAATPPTKTETTLLKQRTDSNKLNRRLKSLADSGRPFVSHHYRQLPWGEARRAFARKLELDPTASWLEVQEREWASDHAEKSVEVGLLWIWDVARLNGLVWRPNDKA